MLEMTNNENPFGGPYEAVLYQVILKGEKKVSTSDIRIFHLSGITAWVPWTKESRLHCTVVLEKIAGIKHWIKVTRREI